MSCCVWWHPFLPGTYGRKRAGKLFFWDWGWIGVSLPWRCSTCFFWKTACFITWGRHSNYSCWRWCLLDQNRSLFPGTCPSARLDQGSALDHCHELDSNRFWRKIQIYVLACVGTGLNRVLDCFRHGLNMLEFRSHSWWALIVRGLWTFADCLPCARSRPAAPRKRHVRFNPGVGHTTIFGSSSGRRWPWADCQVCKGKCPWAVELAGALCSACWTFMLHSILGIWSLRNFAWVRVGVIFLHDKTLKTTPRHEHHKPSWQLGLRNGPQPLYAQGGGDYRGFQEEMGELLLGCTMCWRKGRWARDCALRYMCYHCNFNEFGFRWRSQGNARMRLWDAIPSFISSWFQLFVCIVSKNCVW